MRQGVPVTRSDFLTPDAVTAICRHMNDDHRDDGVLICRHLAGVPDAVDAEAVGVDAEGMSFAVRRADGSTQPVSVAFGAPVTERAQVRTAVVELYERACAAAGVEPRPH